MWWQDAVIYQIYPRSFQDSDGDGVGDLRGIEQRLDHLAWLGVDALWLSPIYPSPMHDFGYDVADYKGVDPVFGSLDDFDSLVAAARERGLRVLMDVVPCHTSIEHPWFREHPDWYIWADSPNNWVAAFGGSAWSELNGRYYLHSFYPEQPDLDWRNPELIAAMQDALGFWIERGIAGYRVDAIDRLMKDVELRDDPPATEPFALPLHEEAMRLAGTNSRNAPDIGTALAKIREAVGDRLLVGEVYLPSAEWQPYLEHLDAAFAFELLHSPWDAERMRAAIEASTRRPGAAWVLSNHDFGRLVTRFGPENARAAALLLLTLPGPAFLYQGDEIGLGDASAGERESGPLRARPFPPPDAVGRLAERRLHDRGGVAAARGPGAHQRRGPARRPALDALAGARPAHGEEGAGRRLRAPRRPAGRARVPPRRPSGRHQHDFGGGARAAWRRARPRDRAGRVEQGNARRALRRDYAV